MPVSNRACFAINTQHSTPPKSIDNKASTTPSIVPAATTCQTINAVCSNARWETPLLSFATSAVPPGLSRARLLVSVRACWGLWREMLTPSWGLWREIPAKPVFGPSARLPSSLLHREGHSGGGSSRGSGSNNSNSVIKPCGALLHETLPPQTQSTVVLQELHSFSTDKVSI